MKLFVLTGLAAFGIASSALAQTAAAPTAAQMEMAYNSARNQLGVLKYCQNEGHIDGDAATIQTKLLGMIPPPADKTAGDEAEKTGEKGTIAAMGVNQEISATVKAQNITEKQFCETIANAIKQVGAQLPK